MALHCPSAPTPAFSIDCALFGPFLRAGAPRKASSFNQSRTLGCKYGGVPLFKQPSPCHPGSDRTGWRDRRRGMKPMRLHRTAYFLGLALVAAVAIGAVKISAAPQQAPAAPAAQASTDNLPLSTAEIIR